MSGNFKVRCLDDGGCAALYTVGDVYELNNGKLVTDNGATLPIRDIAINSFEDWQGYSAAKWELVIEKKSHPTIKVNRKGNRVTAILFIDGNYHCSSNSKMKDFDMDYGKAVKSVIDKVLKKFEKLEMDKDTLVDCKEEVATIREVERKAEAGEYVRVVDAQRVPKTNGVAEYKNGDVLKILKTENGMAKYGEGHAGNGLARNLYDSEYVVLEGYTSEEEPTIKEVKRPAEIGEYVKIIDGYPATEINGVPEYKNGDILRITHIDENDRHYGPSITDYLLEKEYVVLEGYQPEVTETIEPEQPKETPYEFKVGDRVELIVNHGRACKGDTGIIINLFEDKDATVEFDKNVGGHNGNLLGNTKGREGHCYHCKPDELKLITEDPQSTPSNIDWEKATADKTVIHCDTEEKAKALLKECGERGIYWVRENCPATHTNYRPYGSKTCYNINGGKEITYSDLAWYQRNGYTIIEYDGPTEETQEPQPNPNPLAEIPINDLLEEIKRRTC